MKTVPCSAVIDGFDPTGGGLTRDAIGLGRVADRPVPDVLVRGHRAVVAAAHRDDDVGRLDGLGGEDLRLLGGQVDALLEHRLSNGRVDRVCGCRPGRGRSRA